MTGSISNRMWIATFAAFSALTVLVGLFITQTANFTLHPDLLSLAVTIDIVVGIPLLYYFTISKKLKVDAVTTLIIFFVCTGIATLIIPEENQFYLDQIKKLLIVTESVIIIYGIIKVRKIARAYRYYSAEFKDFVYNLTRSFSEISGHSRAMGLVVGELSMLRYGLFFWLGGKEVNIGQRSYSTYRRSGYIALWSVLCMVALVETVAVHFLLWNWNQGIAVAALVLSMYSIIFLIADITAIIRRPVVFNKHTLFLRIGLRWNAAIDQAQIKSAEIITHFDKRNSQDTLDCSLIGRPNVRLIFSAPVTIIGYYGFRKTARSIVFNIDDAEKFLKDLADRSSDTTLTEHLKG